ncbi:MAG: hypothetical protein PUE94_01480, partial [Lachnospiraceae bacterium]|nr:hypothetical protein [Lachnospiraceae bacterium]
PLADILFAISKPRLSTRLVWGRIMKKSFSNEVFIHLMITSYRLIVMILCIRKEGFVKKRCSQRQEPMLPKARDAYANPRSYQTNVGKIPD